jgi:hypothetical protein
VSATSFAGMAFSALGRGLCDLPVDSLTNGSRLTRSMILDSRVVRPEVRLQLLDRSLRDFYSSACERPVRHSMRPERPHPFGLAR